MKDMTDFNITTVNRDRLHYSTAYCAGQERAIARAAQHGTTNLTPSLADRHEFDGDWRAFMQGWHAGMVKVSMELF